MELAEYYQSAGVTPDEDGWFWQPKPVGGLPVGGQSYIDAIRTNVARNHPSLKKQVYDRRTFVYVGAGPTMKDHVDLIRSMVEQPDKYLVTCTNKTGKFLLSKGIVPHVHWIIDPKQSKAADFDVTHENTEYWLNVGCHPDVFDNVEKQGRKIKMFLACSNVGGNEYDQQECEAAMKEEGIPYMLLLAGGMTAGLRALPLADALGFRKLEYFGFDGCIIGEDVYAYEKERKEAILEVEAEDGRVFDSTPALSGQAQQFLIWRDMLPWVDVTIHGDGFIRHMMKLQEKREVQGKYRYTDDYKQMQQQFHHDCAFYGTSGHTIQQIVGNLAKQVGGTILDYGCGKQSLQKSLPELTITGYDPFVEGLDAEPEPADVVVCSDVMEHVEPACVSAVLDHLQQLTRKVIVFHIPTGPAIKTLPDGRNAHVTQRPHDWWFKRIKERFLPAEVSTSPTSLLVVAQSIPAVEEKLYAHH